MPSFSCSCPLGYSASLCEIPVPNACDSGPCRHGGTCLLRTLDNYTCACPSGFRGAKCEAVDHCAYHPCKNGAQCTSLSDSYRCTCASGFTGTTCNLDIDECKRNPCVHGRCVNTHGSYKSVFFLFSSLSSLFSSYVLWSSTICLLNVFDALIDSGTTSKDNDCQMITELTRQSFGPPTLPTLKESARFSNDFSATSLGHLT